MKIYIKNLILVLMINQKIWKIKFDNYLNKKDFH